MTKRIIYQRHHGLHSPGEEAAHEDREAARLVAAEIATWHPDDAPKPVEGQPHAVAPQSEEEQPARLTGDARPE
jgi:hypothetical protein